jgi:hypothetical protein
MKHTSYQQQLNTDEILQRHPAGMLALGVSACRVNYLDTCDRNLSRLWGFQEFSKKMYRVRDL